MPHDPHPKSLKLLSLTKAQFAQLCSWSDTGRVDTYPCAEAFKPSAVTRASAKCIYSSAGRSAAVEAGSQLMVKISFCIPTNQEEKGNGSISIAVRLTVVYIVHVNGSSQCEVQCGKATEYRDVGRHQRVASPLLVVLTVWQLRGRTLDQIKFSLESGVKLKSVRSLGSIRFDPIQV